MLGDLLRNPFASHKHRTVAVDIQNEGMQALFELLASGRLRPAITREYPLAQAADAVRESLTGRAIGKLVLTVSG
jgi:NADPH:quinone reductase-like Zn-dependent oxidoreductase